MSSGCVLKNLFKCEKKCDSVKARKALLKDFTSKVYNAEVVYVDNDGKTTEEQYAISFQLSKNQKDETLTQVQGNAIIQNGEDAQIKCSLSGIYLAKKRGYKMRLIGDNIEKDFYVDCDGNETINFLIKKTASELGTLGSERRLLSGTGSLTNIDKKLTPLINELKLLYEKQHNGDNSNVLDAQINSIAIQVDSLRLNKLKLIYNVDKKVPLDMLDLAVYACAKTSMKYNFCQDHQVIKQFKDTGSDED